MKQLLGYYKNAMISVVMVVLYSTPWVVDLHNPIFRKLSLTGYILAFIWFVCIGWVLFLCQLIRCIRQAKPSHLMEAHYFISLCIMTICYLLFFVAIGNHYYITV